MQATCLYLQIALGGTQKLEEHIARNLVSLEQDCTRFHKAEWDDRGAIISKNIHNWRRQMSRQSFNIIDMSYIENMSTVLKPEEIAFGVSFFLLAKTASVMDILKLLLMGVCL